MPFDKPIINTSNPYRREGTTMENISRTIYYAEVVSIDDDTDGGRIKARIAGLDNQIAGGSLPWSYPYMPRYIHIYPKVGEIVRIMIENSKYPQRGRFWIGSVISQPQKIGFDSLYSALSTSEIAFNEPLQAPSTYPDSDGVFPTKEDIAIVGRVNTDLILRTNEVHLRAGKHENDNILKLNTKNPAEISLIYKQSTTTDLFESNTVVMSDKIALISHTGNPKIKPARLTNTDIDDIFSKGHPIPRGDLLIQALDVMRNAIISHIHGYSNLPTDTTAIIHDLQAINFENILQKNIVIN